MIERFAARMLIILLGCNLAGQIYSAEIIGGSTAGKPAMVETNTATTNIFHPLVPGPVDGQIALITAQLLQNYNYLHPRFNAEVSGKFFDRYFEAYDPQHVHFLKSDIAEFEPYRTNLDRLTLRRPRGETRLADEVFNRFIERLEQRVAYVDNLLKTEKFTFDTDERVVVNRKELPYPKDLDEAKKLWRERLRFEYLQEKLARIDAKKEAATAKNTNGLAGAEAAPGASAEGAETRPQKTDAEEIVDSLTRLYHRNLRYFEDYDDDDVLQAYLTTLAHVYDPHSDYFARAQADNFAIAMNLSLFGIGAELHSEDGYCTITRLIVAGPAFKSQQIHEKDRIVAVAQSNQPPVNVVDMSLNKAVQLIRGPKGTEVRLTIIPAGASLTTRKVVTLVRDEISLEEQAAKARIIEWPEGGGETVRLGVIDLPSFYFPMNSGNDRAKDGLHYASADVATLLAKFKRENVQGVILDLRRNGGGSLEEAIKLTGLFIKEGPVVQVRAWDNSVQEQDDTDPSVAYDGPLIVLTSRFSASASEILAGALQDYGRALVVGDASTFGKGTVQQVLQLKDALRPGSYLGTNDLGELKVTIKKFYRASGVSTELTGVIPDIVLPSVLNEAKEIGESALDNPMASDSIPSARFDRLDMVSPCLPELRKRSAQRVAADKEFDYIRQDIATYKKQQADKTVSLNERERLKEKEEADARTKARDNERRARKEAPQKVYELTLKQALQPGLSAPLAITNSVTITDADRADIGAKLALAMTNSATTRVSAPGNQGPLAAGTNGMGAAGHVAVKPEKADAENKPPVPDPDLFESEHILVDYLSMLPKGAWATVTAGHPNP